MRKYISGILVIAIMIGIFAASAIGTSAKADAQYDLDDPEQRLAYEMTFLTGSRSMERAKYIVDQDADLTIFSTGKATGVVNVIGDKSIVTDIRILCISKDMNRENGRPFTATTKCSQANTEQQ